MDALKCDVCGGRLLMQAGGKIATCDSCGMAYSLERIREKVQEISGTVRVEGTVKVAGAVTIENGVSKDSLVKRGHLALEDQKWDEAATFFDQALNIDPEFAEAYFGLVLAKSHCSNSTQFGTYFVANGYQEGTEFERAKLYCTDAQRIEWEALEQEYSEYLKEAQRLKEQLDAQKKYAEEQKYAEQKRAQEEHDSAFRRKVKQAQLASKLIALDFRDAPAGYISTLDIKGNITIVKCEYHPYYYNKNKPLKLFNIPVKKNSNYIQTGVYCGLKTDASLYLFGKNKRIWLTECGICSFKEHYNSVIALTQNGEIVERDLAEKKSPFILGRDAVSIENSCYIHSDGTVELFSDSQNEEYDRVRAWTAMRQIIYSGTGAWVGLTQHGTVVDSKSWMSQFSSTTWHDIIAIAGDAWDDGYEDDRDEYGYTIALNMDGTLDYRVWGPYEFRKFISILDTWNDIVAVKAHRHCVVGIKKDGSLISTMNYDLSKFKLFDDIETLQQDRIAFLNDKKEELHRKIESLSGLFTAARRIEYENNLVVLDELIRDCGEFC